MAAHPMVGAVLFANRTLFVAPAGMHLPVFPAGSVLVIEYKIIEGRNVLTHVPEPRR